MKIELQNNTTLSHYRIISKIGEGGMGEVYRAQDSRLDRQVAIKVLPADFANDADRLKRFEQEAKATSALNHPNILTVYDIGEYEGSPFIVSELLEGEELRASLDEGRIPVRKVIDYAQQIVSGLTAAHEKGIVHRDLKPENLFVTNDGRVKILDFGLAKLREPDPNIHGSEDATRRALTNPGVVMGTVGYMSPEQVRGNATDHRSDIFSFGVILYEMLTGEKPFRGDSVIETMNAILKEDVPEFDSFDRKMPPSFEKVMLRCLEKKPEQRFYSAHDLGFALEAVSASSTSSGTNLTTTTEPTYDASADGKGWLRWLGWAAAAVFLLTALVVSAIFFRHSEPAVETMRFTIAPPEKVGFGEASAISPDGRQIAFIGVNGAGATSLWVRPLLSIEARQLPGTEGAAFPFWSPDSRSLAFFAAAKLRKIEAAGGPIQTLAEASTDPRGGIWAADGTIIFAPGTISPLMRVSASGGPASPFTTLDLEKGQGSHRWPSLMADGRHFIYFGRGNQPEHQGLYVASIDSPEPKFLVQTSVMGAYAETGGKGFLLFMRDSTLMAQPFDSRKLELSGEAAPIVPGLLSFPGEAGPTAYGAFSATGERLLYRTGGQQASTLTWFDRTGKSLGAITDPGDFHEPSLSADDKKLLFGSGSGTTDGAGAPDIFSLDLTRGNTTRLTFDPASQSSPIFSPDQSRIAYTTTNANETGIHMRASNGSGSEELILSQATLSFADSWSKDGKFLLYETNGGAENKVRPLGNTDVWR